MPSNPVGAWKGPDWERALAREFSLWISAGLSKDILWRTHGSGGFATNLRKQGRNLTFQGGDLGLLDPQSVDGIEFLKRFIVEAKHLKPEIFWPGAAGWTMIERFWVKATKEAEGRVVLLVMKINHQEPMVFMPRRLYKLCAVLADDEYWSGTMRLPSASYTVGFLPLSKLLHDCQYSAVRGWVDQVARKGETL